MSVQGLPEPTDLDDQVLVMTSVGAVRFTSLAVRRDTHEPCCTSCGGTRDLELLIIGDVCGKPYRASLCPRCAVTMRRWRKGARPSAA